MLRIRKRIQPLENSQSQTIGTATDQIARRVLEHVSYADLNLLGSAEEFARYAGELHAILPGLSDMPAEDV
jgi:hypothetical protein